MWIVRSIETIFSAEHQQIIAEAFLFQINHPVFSEVLHGPHYGLSGLVILQRYHQILQKLQWLQHPEVIQKEVIKSGADIGLSFDGDGDRIILVDHQGEIRDGDFILAISGRYLLENNLLHENKIVATVISNIGLEKSLQDAGGNLVRSSVGDREVVEKMLEVKAGLGGEQSGHIIFLDIAHTGDGILTALQILKIMAHSGTSLNALSRCMKKYPQISINLRVKSMPPLDEIAEIVEAEKKAEGLLEGNGRILLRYSGTEPLIRIMLEGSDQTIITKIAEDIAGVVKQKLC